MAKQQSQAMKIWGEESADDFIQLGHKHLEWMQAKSYSPGSIQQRQYYLGGFIVWCREREIASILQVTEDIIEKYNRSLMQQSSERSKDGKLSKNARRNHLRNVRMFFRWLQKKQYLLQDPCKELILPGKGNKLPKDILSASQVEEIINQTDTKSTMGIRNRAILETLYSSGIRRNELVNLAINDVDLERGTLIIIQGKGRKDRLVPIGERACHWIKKYLIESRPKLLKDSKDHSLFITKHGRGFQDSQSLRHITVKYFAKAEIGKPGSCHIFRHTMATRMLENGADIRYLQEILGHTNLSTTEIYTRVAIDKLKQIHALTHPAERYGGGHEI